MSDVGAASNGNASKSHLAAVQASIDKVENFTPKCDEIRLSELKEEAERLRKLRQDNRRLQKNEKRKRSRLLAKGSGWNSHDILECFRIKHERELKKQRTKQERPETADQDKAIAAGEEIQTRTEE